MAKRKSWALRIDAAEKRGKFTRFEITLAKDNWATCAVGERRGFPAVADWDRFGYYGTPECKLGVEFGVAVTANNIPEARRLYEAIMALPAEPAPQ